MRIQSRYEKQSGFSLISMVIVLAIIAILSYIVSKKYMNNTSEVTSEARKALAEQGINAGNLPQTVQKAQQAAVKANETNRKIQENLKEQLEQTN